MPTSYSSRTHTTNTVYAITPRLHTSERDVFTTHILAYSFNNSGALALSQPSNPHL